jgi:hypothetical protein
MKPILCECCGSEATHFTGIGGGGKFYMCAECMAASIDLGQNDPSVSAPYADEFHPIPAGETGTKDEIPEGLDPLDGWEDNGGCL